MQIMHIIFYFKQWNAIFDGGVTHISESGPTNIICNLVTIRSITCAHLLIRHRLGNMSKPHVRDLILLLLRRFANQIEKQVNDHRLLWVSYLSKSLLIVKSYNCFLVINVPTVEFEWGFILVTSWQKMSFTATKVTSKNIFSRIYIDLRLLITPLVSSNFLLIEFCYLFYSFK
jgi:hypothetical protein